MYKAEEYKAREEFKISERTARAIGVAMGHVAFDQMKGLDLIPSEWESVDCVGVEESDIWELCCDQYWTTARDDKNYDVAFKTMYETVRQLVREYHNTKQREVF